MSTTNTNGYDVIKETLKSLISDFRYEHSLRVAKESLDLARYYQLNSDDAFVAGLIHDAAKEITVFESDLNFSEFHLSLYKSFPEVAHAFVLDVVVATYFSDISDTVIQAAMWHTKG